MILRRKIFFLIGISVLFVAVLMAPLLPMFSGAEAQEPDYGAEDIFSYGTGLRAWGMGGAFAALSDDASGGSWNPAGLVNAPREELSLLHVVFFEDTVYQHLGYVYPILDVGTLGIGITRLGTEGIILYDERGNPVGTTSNMQGQAMFSFATGLPWSLWGSLAAGANVKLIMHELAGYSASGFGLDVGLLYQPRFIRNFYLGINAQNLVSPRLKLFHEEDVFPMNLRVGMAYKLLTGSRNQLILAIGADQNADSAVRTHLGMEFSYGNFFAARIGMNEGKFSAGAGFGSGDFWVDYAFSTTDLGSVNKFSLTYRLGPTVAEKREENSRRLQKEVERKVQEGVKSLLAEQIKAGVEEQMRLLTEKKVTEFYQQGLNYLQQGEYSQAIESFQKVLAWSAEHPEVQTSLKKATEDLMKATAESRLDEGKNFYGKGQLEEAIFKWKEVLEIDPQHREAQDLITRARSEVTQREVETIFNEALALFNKGDISKAEVKFKQVVDLSPEHPSASRYLQQIEETLRKEKISRLYAEGMDLYQKENYDEAIFKFRNLLEISPENVEAQKGLIMAQQAMETAGLNRLVEKLMKEGMAYYQSGNWSSAEQVFQQILILKPDYTEAQKYQEQSRNLLLQEKVQQLLLAGIKFIQENKLEDARIKFYQILELEPTEERAKQHLQKIEDEERLRSHQELVERFYQEGEEHYLKGEYDLAQIKYRQVLDLEPTHADAQARLNEVQKQLLQGQVAMLMEDGISYYKNGKWEEAELKFHNVLELIPDSQLAKEYLQKISQESKQQQLARSLEEGKDYYQKGSYQEAIFRFRQVLDLEPTNEEAQSYLQLALKTSEQEEWQRLSEKYYQEGLQLYESNRLEEAGVKFRQALDLNPEYSSAAEYLTKLQEKEKQLRMENLLAQAEDFIQKGLYEEARVKVKTILEEEPQQAEAQQLLQKIDDAQKEARLQETITQLYTQGVKLYQDGQYEEAGYRFREILALNPDHEEAGKYFALSRKESARIQQESTIGKLVEDAQKLYQEGRYDEVLQRLRQIKDLDPQNKRAGDLELQVQQAQAATEKERLRIQREQSITKLLAEGQEFYQKENYENAIFRFQQVLDLMPEHIQAGEFLKMARDALQKQQTRTWTEEIFREGVSLFERGNYAESVVKFTQVLDLIPGFSQAEDYRQKAENTLRQQKIALLQKEGEKFYQTKDWVNATIKFEQILELDSGYQPAKDYLSEIQKSLKVSDRLQLGISYFTVDDPGRAIKEFEQVLQLYPEHPVAEDYLARSQRRLRELIDEYQAQATVYQKENRLVEALELWNEILKLDPARKDIKELITATNKQLQKSWHYMRGLEYYEQKKFREAIMEFQTVLNIDSAFQKAREYLRLATLELSPEQKFPSEEVLHLYSQGMEYYLNEKYEEAIATWEDLLKLDPYNLNALRNIEDARTKLEKIKSQGK